MKKAYCFCPECGQRLIYLPEVMSKDKRPVFRCNTKKCEETNDNYFVLGNPDNFENIPA